jgi:diguanylate cyclase (GGDEF)-like protein
VLKPRTRIVLIESAASPRWLAGVPWRDFHTPRTVPGHAQQALNDPERLAHRHRSGLLDGATTPMLDRLTRIASALLDVPISLVSLVDNAGQHFPGLTGLGGWAGERRGTALSHSFCQHVVTGDAPLVIGDAQDSPLVADNLAVSRLGVIAYAGVPLRTSGGHTLGALCAIDGVPKQWTAEQLAILEDVASLAMREIEARAAAEDVQDGRDAHGTTHDPLTGLLNSRGLLERWSTRGETSASRTSCYSVLSVDIDGFRAFNDAYGHARGNARLGEVSSLLIAMTGDTGTVARTGVDEFVIVLPDADAARCAAFESRLRATLAERNAHASEAEGVSLSIGSATCTPSAPLDFAQVLHNAEVAMYRAMGTRLQPAEPVRST